MATSGIPPVVEKLCRAAKHANEFMGRYVPWHTSRPYRPVSYLEPHPTKPGISKGSWRVELTEEPPLLDWAVLTGELLYQLRSTLEHLAYEAAGLNSHPRFPPSGTGFPIFLNRDKYDQRGSHMTRGMSDTVRALVKELQPFNPGWDDDPRLHPLWLLHELSDTDRHESPHLAVSLARIEDIQVGHTRNAEVLAFKPREGPFKDGAEIAAGVVRWLHPTDCEVHVNLSLSAEIAFSIPRRAASKPYAGLPVAKTLSDIHWFVLCDVFIERLCATLWPGAINPSLPPPLDMRPSWQVLE